jgi:hypothetical protein
LEQGFCPLHPASHPKLKALDRLHLPVVGAVEICLRGANMGMAHQRLDGSKIISIIQKGRGEGMVPALAEIALV